MPLRKQLRSVAQCLVTIGMMIGPLACSEDSTPNPAGDASTDLGGPGDDGALGDAGSTSAEAMAVLGVEESESWQLPGLTNEVHILEVEAGIPHLFAHDRNDLGVALGFTLARDRYFVMDLQRRLGLGTVASLLGDLALGTDIESRLIGMRHVADQIVANLDPDLSSYLQSFVDGVNLYIEGVQGDLLQAPSELELAAGILGANSPGALMEPWSVRDVAAMTAVIMYQTTFDTDDIARSAAALTHEDLFVGDQHQDLRQTGFLVDILQDATPLYPYTTSAGLGLNGALPANASAPPAGSGMGKRSQGHRSIDMYRRLAQNLLRLDARLRRERHEGIGSNTWAVAGSHSRDGYTLVAGDGHLPLAVPAVTYQVGLNTKTLGGGDIHQTGILLAQLPVLGVGTNGKVAWSQVNPYADTTDWYQEELQLNADGMPVSTRFQGEDRPLIRIDEVYEIAAVPALGSEGGTSTIPRFTTFDGRWITDIEGRDVGDGFEPDNDRPTIRLMNRHVQPEDLNGDGIITAVSLDYAGFDTGGFVNAADAMGHAQSAEELRQAMRGLVGSGLYTAGGDDAGNIVFSSYQAVPCRGYLTKDAEGRWEPGANPRFLIDGTRFGGFTIPITQAGAAEGDTDPYRCVIPFDVMPQGYNPDTGFLVAANNDPANLSTDGRLDDGPWYIGGPWSSTRAAAIADGLQQGIADGEMDVERMAMVQATRASRLGQTFAPHLLTAINRAKTLSLENRVLEPHESRVANLYSQHNGRITEAQERLTEWSEAGYDTPSGVDTFYDQPNAADRRAAVATMIFNVFLRELAIHIWGDEGVDDSWTLPREQYTILSMARILAQRGDAGERPAGSTHPDTDESIFFDLRGTDEIERSDEVILLSLVSALDYLEAPPTGPNQGGFGTGDMTEWLWGLRHQARFESLLSSFLGDNPQFSFLVDRFAITTDTLPLAENLAAGDPRAALKWFPRGGDQWAPDAANPGLFGDDFTHGNGPVMRMVIGLKSGQVKGQNIIPGGQSGLTDSTHYADQAALWLGNETLPLRYHTEDVVEGAVGRIRIAPGEELRRIGGD